MKWHNMGVPYWQGALLHREGVWLQESGVAVVRHRGSGVLAERAEPQILDSLGSPTFPSVSPSSLVRVQEPSKPWRLPVRTRGCKQRQWGRVRPDPLLQHWG